MAMPRAKTKSQVADDQRLKVLGILLINREVIRFWDNTVPISGRQRDAASELFFCHPESRGRGMRDLPIALLITHRT